MTIVVGIENGTAEEATSKLLVLFILEFGQQLLIGPIFRVKALDRLQHKGIHYLFVVVPVEALVFEQAIKLFVVEDEGFVELAPQFAVGFVGVVC